MYESPSTPLTTVEKISRALRGNKNSLGHKASPETRALLRIVRLGNINNKGKLRSAETRARLRANAKRGPEAWNWKGGTSLNKHRGLDYDNWRQAILTRDDWTCQNCHQRGVYLEAHHIKSWAEYPEERYNLDNGIVLCSPCHKLTDNYRGKNTRKAKMPIAV